MVAASGGLSGVYNIRDLGFGDTTMFKHDPGPCGFHFHRVSIGLDRASEASQFRLLVTSAM